MSKKDVINFNDLREATLALKKGSIINIEPLKVGHKITYLKDKKQIKEEVI